MLKLQEMRELVFEPKGEVITASNTGAVLSLPLLSSHMPEPRYAVFRPGKEVLYTNDLLLARDMVGEPSMFPFYDN